MASTANRRSLHARLPSPITISLHTEAIDAVTVTEMSTGVSLQLGDDVSGVALLGPLDAVHQLVVEADRQLSRLRCPT